MADSHGKIKIISYALLAFGLAFPLLIFILPVSGQTVGTYSYYSIALNFISIPAIVMAGLISLVALNTLIFLIGLLMFFIVFLIGLINELAVLAFELPPLPFGHYTTALANLSQMSFFTSIWLVFVGVLIIGWNRFVRKIKKVI